MLFLVLQLGSDRYAIQAAQVVEVLPLVRLKQLPNAPAGVAGILDFHGEPVPVIDLSDLALGRPSRQVMSTRIILVNYREETGGEHVLGLIAEHATETLRRSEGDFITSGVALDKSPYLGAITTDAAGIVQRIEIRHLLSEEVRAMLFREAVNLA